MSREKGKREDILKAATEVFGSKGFYLANMIDIAERAGIGKGTIYEYFKSKDSLFIEVVKYNAAKHGQMLEQQVNLQKTFMDKIQSFIACVRTIIKENTKSACMFLKNPTDISLTAEIKKELYNFLLDVRNKVVRLLVEILSQGRKESVIRDTDIEFAADMLLEMIIRCSIRSVLLNLSDKQIQQENEKLLDLFMLGAGNAINYCK